MPSVLEQNKSDNIVKMFWIEDFEPGQLEGV